MYIYMCIFRCCNVLYIGKILPREFFSPASLSIYTRVTVPVLSNIIYLIYDYCMCVVSCICLTVSNCHLFMLECLDKKLWTFILCFVYIGNKIWIVYIILFIHVCCLIKKINLYIVTRMVMVCLFKGEKNVFR